MNRLTKDAEQLWSLVIRGRAGFRCELYGIDHIRCSFVIEAMHIVTRGVRNIKYDQRNGRSGCTAHHKFYSHQRELWAALCMRLWPEDWEYLIQRKWHISKPRPIREVIGELLPLAERYRVHYLPHQIQALEKILERNRCVERPSP